MKYFVGFDGGSTYLKAALFDGKQVVDTLVCNTGIDNNGTSEDMLRKICKKNGLARNDIGYIMATGYSRKILEIADDDISEITAHAYGVRVTAPKEYHPGIVVDIGGQDSKIIYLDENYNIRNFTMNDKCAAGTRKFLEIAAQILETTIDQIGPLSLESKEPCDINSTCVVFAQSEVISLVARKYDRRDILYGMHLSMAKRIIKMIVSAFLSAYIVSHGNGVKKSFGTFMLFFSGKLLGVSVLCLAVSTIGKQFISEKGYIGDFPFRLAVQVMMGLFGFFMAVRWFREIRKGMAECGHCKECGIESQHLGKLYPMLAAGILYGITPCPPLLFVLGYSVSLPVLTAGITGISFSLASILSTLLMLVAVLGVLSKRIWAEIPGFLKWFRLASYVLLMVLPFTLQ